MKLPNRVAAGLAAVSMLAGGPAFASDMSSAEKIRRLDIMLMVTGLRCRTGADNFQVDYRKFTSNNIATLNRSARALSAEMGPRALDRLSVTMANEYGQGHPWLGCRELKMVAQNLAETKGEAPLVAAADQLLNSGGATQFAFARRR
jgi:hypothetical protein